MDIINGFKGVLDFYVYKGVPCVRSWPRSPGHDRAPAVQAQWPAFTWAAKSWKHLNIEIKEAYNQMAVSTYKTGKDLYMQSFISGSKLYLQDV